MFRPFNQLRHYTYEVKPFLTERMASSSKAQGKKPMSEGMHLVDEDCDYTPEAQPVLKKKASRRQKAPELTPEEYMELFRKQAFEGTRYPHSETMRELGVAEDVESLFQQCHLAKMMHTPCAGYQEETIQFLSSVALHSLPGGLNLVAFRIFDQDYFMPMTQVDALFGFPSGHGTKQDYNKDELDSLWATVSSENVFNSSRSKSSHIRSPVLRYFQKSLANVFFARGNAGTVVNGEVELLDMALKSLLQYAADGTELRGDTTDTSLSYMLVNQLMSYRQWVKTIHTRGTTSVLCVGGIVTLFLEAQRVPLRSVPTEYQWIDLPYLQDAHTVKKGWVGGKLVYNFIRPTLEPSQILLPNVHLTSFSEPGCTSNIGFNPPEESLHSIRTRTAGSSAAAPTTDIPDDPMESGECQPDYSGEGYAPEQYYFDEWKAVPKQGKAVTAAHERINSLQQWNKARDKRMEEQDRELKAQKKQIKSLKSRFRNFMKKFSCSSSAAAVLTRTPSPVRHVEHEPEEEADFEQEEQPAYVEEEQTDYMQEDQPVYENPGYEIDTQVPSAIPARHSSYQQHEREHMEIPARTSAYEPREKKRRVVKRKHKRQGSKRRQEGGPSSEHPPHDQ